MSASASPGPERRQTTPQTQMIGVRWMLLTVLLGGRSAEELVFGDVTTGAERDLVEATRLARRMVTPTRYWSAIGRLRKSR